VLASAATGATASVPATSAVRAASRIVCFNDASFSVPPESRERARPEAAIHPDY
jgi:hypothetical protein